MMSEQVNFRKYQIAAVVPAYRVEGDIAGVLQGLPSYIRHIIVVDDASPDSTSDVVAALVKRDRRLVLLRNDHNQGVRGGGIPHELAEAEVEEEGYHQGRENDFANPDRARGRPQHDHQPSREQREGNPNDQKGDAIDAGDRGDLDEWHHLILGRAQQVPGKAGEEPNYKHLEGDPEGGAGNGPEGALGPVPGQNTVSGYQPDPGGRIEREVCAQGEPPGGGAERDRVPAVGNQEQPVKGSEVIGQAGDVADAEAFPATFAKGGGEHQRWGNPRQSGNADFGEGGSQQESCESRRKVTAAHD